jgi:hypothetical protein
MLAFAAPQALTSVSTAEPKPSFPRAGNSVGALFYSSGHPSDGHLYFTNDYLNLTGQRVSGASAPPEVGPLYVASSGGLDFDLLFTRIPADGPRSIMTAEWNEAMQSMGGIAAAPMPVNGASSNDHNVAFAPGELRYWWVSDRAGAPELYTFQADDSPTEQVVQLTIQGPGGPCPVNPADVAPWVTPDGTLMLFAAEAVDDACSPRGTSDLFGVLLGGDGQPATPAASLGDDVNAPAASEITPSLSADGCTLFFASDESSAGASLTIFRAPRR